MSFSPDFPVNVSVTCFTRYAHFPDQKNEESQIKQKSIIVGGFQSNEEFYEFTVNDDRHSVVYKSLTNNHDKKFANLKHIGLRGARFVHSYLIHNNKYLVLFMKDWYNVYDMENDRWFLNQVEQIHLLVPNTLHSRSVLIHDEIIIVSYKNDIHFHFIANEHLTVPAVMARYILKTKTVDFFSHGMSIIDFVRVKQQLEFSNKTKDADDVEVQTYTFKIILFGGCANKHFLSSFVYLDVLLSYVSNENYYKLVILSIDEYIHDKRDIKMKHISRSERENQ